MSARLSIIFDGYYCAFALRQTQVHRDTTLYKHVGTRALVFQTVDINGHNSDPVLSIPPFHNYFRLETA